MMRATQHMLHFFDYDNDGDLDLYVLTNFLDTPTPNSYRPKKLDGTAESNDRLYRNNGNNTFTNVTLRQESFMKVMDLASVSLISTMTAGAISTSPTIT
jgi:hypothetical protein